MRSRAGLPVAVVEVLELDDALVGHRSARARAARRPGSASAAASSAPAGAFLGLTSAGLVASRLRAPSVAATATSADAVAAGRAFLAEVDVLQVLRVELVGVELHRGLREVLLLPRLAAARTPRSRRARRSAPALATTAKRFPCVILSARRALRGCAPRARALRSSWKPLSTSTTLPRRVDEIRARHALHLRTRPASLPAGS